MLEFSKSVPQKPQIFYTNDHCLSIFAHCKYVNSDILFFTLGFDKLRKAEYAAAFWYHVHIVETD